MKGTITWLPIEDAPRDGNNVLVWGETENGHRMWQKGYYEPHSGEYLTASLIKVTHFAYINKPEGE